MRSLILSRRDLDFLLHDWLDVAALTSRERFADHSRETFDAVLDLAEELATEKFAPHNRTADLAEPHVVDGTGAADPRGAGGAGRVRGVRAARAPRSTTRSAGCSCRSPSAGRCLAWFQAANTAHRRPTRSSPSPTRTCCSRTGPQEQVDTLGRADARGPLLRHDVPVRTAGGLVAGRHHHPRRAAATTAPTGCSATRCGSPAASTSCRENIVHLVLAKIPGGPAGREGHLAVRRAPVPADDGGRNDVVLAGLNHKMGYRGTTNTLLNFGEGGHRPGGAAGCGRLPGRRGAPRPRATCST